MKYLVILLTTVLYSCTNNKSEITHAVSEVLNEYGGVCKYEVGKKIKLDKTINYYILSIKDSDYIKYFDDLTIPISNIALIFYSNLNKSKNIDEVRINIIIKKDSVYNGVITVNKIKQFQKKEIQFKKINQFILNKQYDELYNSLADVSKKETTPAEIKSIFDFQNEKYGRIINFIRQGFKIDTINVNNQKVSVVNYIATIERQSGNTKLNILIDQKTNEIYSIKFKW